MKLFSKLMLLAGIVILSAPIVADNTIPATLYLEAPKTLEIIKEKKCPILKVQMDQLKNILSPQDYDIINKSDSVEKFIESTPDQAIVILKFIANKAKLDQIEKATESLNEIKTEEIKEVSTPTTE